MKNFMNEDQKNQMEMLEYLFKEMLGVDVKITVVSTPEEESSNNRDSYLLFYIERIAKKRGWKTQRVINWLGNVAEVCPGAALSIMLREIAVYLDLKYEDHIKNSPTIYSVSLTDGVIRSVNKAHIKNYRNFAAFRTIEDAKFACKVLREPIKEMFGCEEKQ